MRRFIKVASFTIGIIAFAAVWAFVATGEWSAQETAEVAACVDCR